MCTNRNLGYKNTAMLVNWLLALCTRRKSQSDQSQLLVVQRIVVAFSSFVQPIGCLVFTLCKVSRYHRN